MEYKDYYAVLGLDKKASADAIKQAYRRLARKFHPDVSKEANAEEKFKNLQEAYEVLKDPEKRAAYDQLGSHWRQGQEFKEPPGWGGGQTRYYTGDAGNFSEEDLGGFSDFFTHLFGGRARGQSFGREGFQQRRERGSDQRATVRLTLEEAFRGTTKNLHLELPEMDASGRVHTKSRVLKVNIPPGAMPGQQLRLAGQASPGMGGGPNGDIYLEIEIEPHRLFTLEGRDVYLTLPVAPWEAALGASIKIPTLAGPVGLKLAAGSHAGQKLRLKGRGMPGKPHSGDQYAIVQIEIPPADTAAKRELYEKMAVTLSFNPRQGWPV